MLDWKIKREVIWHRSRDKRIEDMLKGIDHVLRINHILTMKLVHWTWHWTSNWQSISFIVPLNNYGQVGTHI